LHSRLVSLWFAGSLPEITVSELRLQLCNGESNKSANYSSANKEDRYTNPAVTFVTVRKHTGAISPGNSVPMGAF